MKILKSVIAVILPLSGVWYATSLLSKGLINQFTFCALVIAAIFVGIWIGYSERVRELTLGVGKMNMVLTEMKSTQSDIAEAELRMKALASMTVTLVSQLEKSAIVDESFDQASFVRLKEQIMRHTA